MIYAEANAIDQFHLEVVINFPDGRKTPPVIVTNKEDAVRLVYFHNRLYIADTLRGWLNHRTNVFKHIGDSYRTGKAEMLYSAINKYSLTSLDQLCQLVVDREPVIKYLAPESKSPFFKSYVEKIEPILAFCREMKGPKVCGN